MSARLPWTRVSAFTVLFCFIVFNSLIVRAHESLPRPIPGSHLAEPASSAGTASGYSPTQIRKAYGIDRVKWNGAGQTIALVVAFGSPTVQSDLARFCRHFGLPAAQLTIAYPQGKPAQQEATWAMETALDVQWAHAIAPQAKLLLVVAATGDFDALLEGVDYAVSQGANQISMSFGSPEFSLQTDLDQHFNVPGVSFFASSGDLGAGVQWPAASPYVVGVGGTTLKLDSMGGVTVPETAWSKSSGGSSQFESLPAFQNGVITGSRGRGVPDVSYNTDPATGYAVYNSVPYPGHPRGWMVVGGTSAGSPQWAALSGKAASFSDVRSGCDSASSVDCARQGYDYVTGLGSPVAGSLLRKMLSE